MSEIKQNNSVDFDWDAYADGWNGTNLKQNRKVNTLNGDKVYSHSKDAQRLYDLYCAGTSKDAKADLAPMELAKVSSIERMNDNTILVGLHDGAVTVAVDINKENQFLNILRSSGGEAITKEDFMENLKAPQFRDGLVAMDLHVKVGKNTENVSIFGGYREALENELKEQITKNSKAYIAQLYANNTGGYKVKLCGIIDAFMPGSMAAANRITDFDALVGKSMEVMVEKWDPRTGFIVSRKKYLNTIIPSMINNMKVDFDNNPNKTVHGRITGIAPFGIFVEIGGVITGMMHRTVISDDLADAMQNEQIHIGDEIDVYIHSIDTESNRVVLSDLPREEREKVIAINEEKAEKHRRWKEKCAELIAQGIDPEEWKAEQKRRFREAKSAPNEDQLSALIEKYNN